MTDEIHEKAVTLLAIAMGVAVLAANVARWIAYEAGRKP